jgi:hypothetical protein
MNATRRGQNKIDLAGKRFARLLVIRESPCRDRQGNVVWLCQCDCGRTTEVRGYHLRNGGVSSCDCLRKERAAAANSIVQFKHGMCRTLLYGVWSGMIARCHNPSNPRYKDYGGRGIIVCPQWRRSFASFLEDMGDRPSKDHQLDRINNDGNYEPGNTRWLKRELQARNTRGNTRITLNGETRVLVQWLEILGLSLATYQSRVKRGMSQDAALSTPVNINKSRRPR